MKKNIYLTSTNKHMFIEMIRIIARFFILLTKGGKGLKLFFYYNSPRFFRSFLWKFHNLSFDHLTESHLEQSPFKYFSSSGLKNFLFILKCFLTGIDNFPKT